MTRFKTLLFATVLFIGMTSFMQAQSNVAHINTQELIQAMPEMLTAQAEIEKLGKTYEADIKELAASLQNKMKQYDSEAATQTDEENQKRVLEVQGLEQNIRQYQTNAQKDLQQKEFDLLKPITEKAKAAIEKVAKAQDIQYVLDAATLIVSDGKDLMADVKKELGI